MYLATPFKDANNLGDIARQWLSALNKDMANAGITQNVKTGVEGAASLLAPAALVATVIDKHGFQLERALRVLLISKDPLVLMDEGIWHNYAADLLGMESLEIFSTSREVFRSNLYDAGTQLGLKPASYVEVTKALDAGRVQSDFAGWDLAVWVHPAIEASECEDEVNLIIGLHDQGVPVYACSYNELDALVQSHGLNKAGCELRWLNGSLDKTQFSKQTLNRFGYATSEIGVEGGWGAVITKLDTASLKSKDLDWETVKAGMALLRLEEAETPSWYFANPIQARDATNTSLRGLIGNLAVDPKTGELYSECANTKTLICCGNIWGDLVKALPETHYELVAWAAQAKLASNSFLTREKEKRAETISVLEGAFALGVTDAGIALARGYESTGSVDLARKATALYAQIGPDHPLSAYYLAHAALKAGNESQAYCMMIAASVVGYAPATCDLAIMANESGEPMLAHKLFAAAAEQGDAEAFYNLGVFAIKEGKHETALSFMRKAWSKGHQAALNDASWLCNAMISNGLGKKSQVVRELKDIRYAEQKRVRYMDMATREAS